MLYSKRNDKNYFAYYHDIKENKSLVKNTTTIRRQINSTILARIIISLQSHPTASYLPQTPPPPRRRRLYS